MSLICPQDKKQNSKNKCIQKQSKYDHNEICALVSFPLQNVQENRIFERKLKYTAFP